MIRLIASDLDGTLLQNGAQSLTDEALDLIRKVRRLGIRFVAASGRQYANMKRLFGPIWEDVTFVAENGALIVERDEILDMTAIPRDLARELMDELRADPRCDAVACGINSVYLQPKPETRPSVDFILYELKNTTTIVNDLNALDEDLVKVSAVVYGDKAHELGADLIPRWSGRLHGAVAGKEWVDFTLTNKGEAIEKLRTRLGFQQEELAAFGDNFNDESMFRSVGYSYAMLGAREEIRDMARHCCGSVETVLKNLVDYYS